MGHSSKQYISELTKNSPTIEALNEDFRIFAPKLQIFCFYETLETSVPLKSFVCPALIHLFLLSSSSDLAYISADGTRKGIINSRISRGDLATAGRGPSYCMQVHESRRPKLQVHPFCLVDPDSKL